MNPSALAQSAPQMRAFAPALSAGSSLDGSVEPCISSADLLLGRKTVEISHNGFVYKLQATRQGKLILTK